MKLNSWPASCYKCLNSVSDDEVQCLYVSFMASNCRVPRWAAIHFSPRQTNYRICDNGLLLSQLVLQYESFVHSVGKVLTQGWKTAMVTERVWEFVCKLFIQLYSICKFISSSSLFWDSLPQRPFAWKGYINLSDNNNSKDDILFLFI